MKPNRENYSLFLSEIPEEEKQKMCDTLIKEYGVKLFSDDRGMIMMGAKDCFDTSFYVGEVLGREVKVQLDKTVGWGLTIGDSFESSFIVATVDAAIRQGSRDVVEMVDNWIGDHRQWYEAEKENQQKIAKSTKVNFGLMVEG